MSEASLSFRDKSTFNRRLLERLALRLTDKDTDILPWPGKRYYHDLPANLSLLGSVGMPPDPDFAGPQPPNSMGMVLLLRPDDSGRIRLSIAGQFDVSHRAIPELEVMIRELKRDGATAKPSQPIVTAYRRMTVCFDAVSIDLQLPRDLNTWVRPDQGHVLETQLSALESQCLADPEIFRLCHSNANGNALVDFPWSDAIITSQAALNQVVTAHLFADTLRILPYRVELRARARRPPASLTNIQGAYLVEVFLVNNTARDVARACGMGLGAHLLDVRFSCQLIGGSAHGLPHKLAPVDYRHQAHGTVPGYGVTTGVEQDDQGIFHTITMPISMQTKTRNPSFESLGMPEDAHFLSLRESPISLLVAFGRAVNAYGDQWQQEIDRMIATGAGAEARVAQLDLALLRKEAQAIEDGIGLLQQHPKLAQAFGWMNEVMHNAFVQQRKPITTWRLFQLGFILTQIRAIYERCCPISELTDHIKTAEVLWFATGGGKTEAYLGILVMSMLYERLNQRRHGPTAWMKFPLRMLSVQQFQRLAYVIAQANRIKQRENLAGHPFTVGYFTGEGTPKSISAGYENVRASYLPVITDKQLTQWQFIQDCPYCDAQNSVVMRKDMARSRVLHVCTNPQCWTHTQADQGQFGEGINGEIGIYVSDEEIYRYLPTIMVGTIDKLAVLGHNRRFRLLMGGATHYCPEHGFLAQSKCNHNRIQRKDDGTYESVACGNNTKTSDIRTRPLGPATLPGIQFILQDELHLLAQNTGNFDAHYETTMQAIQRANGGRPAKVLAATATIKGYEEHIHHLYQKQARRFPVPGIKLGESFYSRLDGDEDGPLVQRWYAGILPLGGGRIVERASAITSRVFLTLIDDLRAALVEQPAQAAQQWGLPASKAKVLLNHIETFLNTCLIYNNSIRGNGEVHNALENYQLPHYPSRIWRKLDGATPLDEIQKTIQLIETKAVDDPTRQLIATSVVSHGVDMHRLNFIVVCGWPKSIAEYLQSSARSGRIEPGIVLSVLDSRQLYQTNVYLDFQDYHRFMDRMVESVPINRFAPNLLERTLPGVISACVLNWLEGQTFGDGAGKNAGNLSRILAQTDNGAENNLRSLLLECLSVPGDLRQQFDERVVADYHEALGRQIDRALKLLIHLPSDMATEQLSGALERLLGHPPMRNLRDIESQIQIKPAGDTQALIDALGRRH